MSERIAICVAVELIGGGNMDTMTQYEPADITIHIQGRGIVAKEKCVVAYHKSNDRIVACGTEAYGMAGENREDIVVESPLHQGVVADFPVAVAFFRWLWKSTLGKKRIVRPAVAICAPRGITMVDKKALEEVMIDAGAGKVFFTDILVEEYIRKAPEQRPMEFQKLAVTVGIGKDEPERYIQERWSELLEYARQEHISQERVRELLGARYPF